MTSTVHPIVETNSSFTENPPQAAMRSPLWYWILSLITIIVTNTGNGVVVYLIITRRSLHLTNNYFILSLAVADICTGIFVLPASFICEQLGTCNLALANVFFNTFFFASVANVCALTLDRYISIVIPLKYFIYMNTKRVVAILCASWIVPFIIAVIPETYSHSGKDVMQSAAQIYEPIQILVFVVLPIALMLIVYGRIYIIARRISKQTTQTNNQLRFNDANENESSPSHREKYKKEQRERRNREGSVAVIGVVIVLFALCWFLAVYNSICDIFQICPVNYDLVVSAQLLLHLNSAINPIVYAALKKDIRRELKRLMYGRRRQSAASFGNNSTYSFATSTKFELQ